MFNKIFKERIQLSLAKADIQISGDRPWDLHIHNGQLYSRVFSQGALGLGEAYMDGWWDCMKLAVLFYLVLNAEVNRSFCGCSVKVSIY